MTTSIFPTFNPVLLDIANAQEKFPVHNIYCIGRNYKAHAEELGFSVDKASMKPFYFCKSTSFLNTSGAIIDYPAQTNNFHHEIELVIAIGKTGKNIAISDAESFIYGYAVGLDMTRRDLQAELRDKGLPWDNAKNFQNAAIVSSIYPKTQTGIIDKGEIKLSVNNEIRQKSDLSQMIWNIPEIIADLSTYHQLEAGDLIFTGTPEGVSAVNKGDYLLGEIENLGKIELTIKN
ncbi:MAG: fumarylacetoacetate hydrolase family protein [Cardiobacteriaceae bacterium]|nr:fumarylacetoacetate hydrolase family protein [Cardiobacteriaceae bacterium]